MWKAQACCQIVVSPGFSLVAEQLVGLAHIQIKRREKGLYALILRRFRVIQRDLVPAKFFLITLLKPRHIMCGNAKFTVLFGKFPRLPVECAGSLHPAFVFCSNALDT